jgi:hypothetical protein
LKCFQNLLDSKKAIHHSIPGLTIHWLSSLGFSHPENENAEKSNFNYIEKSEQQKV